MSEIFDSVQAKELATREIESTYKGGFNFDNSIRNEILLDQLKNNSNTNVDSNKSINNIKTNGERNITSKIPQAWKTGTTICGITYKNGVVLGADTRATGGSEVVDKNIICC